MIIWHVLLGSLIAAQLVNESKTLIQTLLGVDCESNTPVNVFVA